MNSFIINGGHKLQGEIIPQGAKNEALQVIAATVLTDEHIEISNIPNIRDVKKLMDLLEGFGVKIEQIGTNDYRFCAKDFDIDFFNSADFQKIGMQLRGSILLLGPILARFGRCVVPRPGGDKIGRRKLDIHFLGIEKLGAKFHYNREENLFNVEAKHLKGSYILLEEASVTGTANIIMAAVLAEGVTTIYNAACEPYIQQLCRMLLKMGAKIEGVGSNLLKIEGVEKLGGCKHRLLSDMIEVGSFIGLAALTGSELTIKNVNYNELGIIPDTFMKLGIKIIRNNDDIIIPSQEVYAIENYIDGSILTIADAPWPGLTPDLLSVILVVATQAMGSVLIHQKMFESRLFFVDKLIDMGARIILCDPHRATVIGMGKTNDFRGLEMVSPDIRAGVALLIAALSAKGTSVIHNIEQIDRGYEAIDVRLKKIGAEIERV